MSVAKGGIVGRLVRSPWFWCAVVVVLLAAYLVSPVIAAAKLAHAVKTHNVPEVMARIEPAPLRRSLTRQLVRGYIVLNKKENELGVLGQQMAMAMGVTVFEPILEQITTPNEMAELLRKGWPVDKDEAQSDTATITIGGLRDLLGRLDSLSYLGLTEIRVVVDIDGTPERKLGWRMRLDGLTWKLYSVDLPPELIKLIIDRLPKVDGLKIEDNSGVIRRF